MKVKSEHIRFSVIIPTLNEQETIVRCISSVRSIRSCVEIIVADGGSTDHTVTMAELQGAKVCHSPRGKGRQCNCGATHATGDVLVFLHSDTTLPPNAFSRLEDIFGDQRVKIGSFYLSFDIDHWVFRLFHLLCHLDPGLMRFGDQCLVLRSSFFRSIGGFPEYSLFEDIGLIQKARKVAKIHRFPMVVTTSARRFRQNGIIRQQLKNMFYTLQYFLGVPPEELANKYERDNLRIGHTSLIIFARFPRPGIAKTRIAKSLGTDLAIAFYRLFAEHTFRESSKLSDQVQRCVFYSERNDEHEIKQWAGSQFRFASQTQGNLGKRIENAFKTVFKEGARKVIIIASDVPDLSARIINYAILKLDEYDVVIGPCNDGGYYLLGMTKPHPQMFDNVLWSTKWVCEQTVRNAEQLRLDVYRLPNLADIDTEEDLRIWLKTATDNCHPVLEYARTIGF